MQFGTERANGCYLMVLKGFFANINMKAKNKVKGSHVVRCRTAPCVVDNWPYILQTEKKNCNQGGNKCRECRDLERLMMQLNLQQNFESIGVFLPFIPQCP